MATVRKEIPGVGSKGKLEHGKKYLFWNPVTGKRYWGIWMGKGDKRRKTTADMDEVAIRDALWRAKDIDKPAILKQLEDYLEAERSDSAK